MNQQERLYYLIDYLSKEIDQTFSYKDYSFDLYRGLVNIRGPKKISDEYLKIEDEYLDIINKQRGIVELDLKENITVWQGDITRLKVDAIVNAANNQLLGCFVPNHACIDNCIHTFAGIRLRWECNELMNKQRTLEPTGKCKVTKAYHLPCQYVFHTVGPIVYGKLENKHRTLLKMCYLSCLEKATEMNLNSIAFCCISTGVFRFPQSEACKIAIETVKEFQKEHHIKVVFNVFKDEDLRLYKEGLVNELESIIK